MAWSTTRSDRRPSPTAGPARRPAPRAWPAPPRRSGSRRRGRGDGRLDGGLDRQNAMAVAETEVVIAAPMQGTIVSVDVVPGEAVHLGQQLLVIESMKMEHVVAAECDG